MAFLHRVFAFAVPVLCLTLLVALWPNSAATHPGGGEEEEQIFETYLAFTEAQNEGDMEAVGAFFVNDPHLLMVADGRAIWGKDRVLARIDGFQDAEHWQAFPDFAKMEIIMLAPSVGLLHVPMVIEVGTSDAPEDLHFLESVVFQQSEGQWYIASLQTVVDKSAAP